MDNKLRKKFSIIIPTMQKDIENLNVLIQELEDDDCVDEIILIDNSLSGYHRVSNKLKIHIPQSNLYVNPSWNLGVKFAKNNYIGILNDDILLPKNFLIQVIDFIDNTENCGAVGIESSIAMESSHDNNYSLPKESKLLYKKIENIYKRKNWFWGSAIFLKKDNYYEIPKEMLINSGDNYLLYKNKMNKKQNYAIYNTSIKHCGSLTSSSKIFNAIKGNDMRFFSTIDKDYKKYRDNERRKKEIINFINKWLYVKNEGIRKVICVFGIKIKLKCTSP